MRGGNRICTAYRGYNKKYSKNIIYLQVIFADRDLAFIVHSDDLFAGAPQIFDIFYNFGSENLTGTDEGDAGGIGYYR